MRCFRLCLVAGSVLLSSASFASFEMLLAVDTNNGRVLRYDPVTGASLGSFGSGYMHTPAKIAVDTAQGLAYVTNYDLSTVQVWNYNTGEYAGEFSTPYLPWGITRLNNGNLVVGMSGQVATFTPSGSLVSSFAASNAYGVGTDGTYLYVSGSNKLVKYTTSGTLISQFNTPSRQVYDVSFRNGVGYCGGLNYAGIFGTFNPTTMSGYVEKTVPGFTTGLDVEGLAFSHYATMYVAGQSTASGTPTVIGRYNLLSGTTTSTFGNWSSGTRFSAMVTVLAPEPGTWAALGFGALVLLRRRKK